MTAGNRIALLQSITWALGAYIELFSVLFISVMVAEPCALGDRYLDLLTPLQ